VLFCFVFVVNIYLIKGLSSSIKSNEEETNVKLKELLQLIVKIDTEPVDWLKITMAINKILMNFDYVLNPNRFFQSEK
jgi:hypothetical protein